MWNEELEKAILYYIIFENEQYQLDETDFVSSRNQQIIKAINELKAKKEAVSILAIQAKINANKKQVLEYLTNLGNYIRTSTADDIYNKLIELSKRRKLFKLLNEKIIEIENSDNIDILIQEIIKEINSIGQINEKEKSFLEQVVDVTEKMEEAYEKGMDYSLYTGLQDLDNKICGLHNQELTIIGARPRSWKNDTSIANRRKNSKQGYGNSDSKLGNVRCPINSKNVI